MTFKQALQEKYRLVYENTNDGWPESNFEVNYTGETSSDGQSKEIVDYLGKYWINKQGQYHNTEQPAIQFNNGDYVWIANGKYHNLNGPALVELNPPLTQYYINDKLYTKEEFDKKIKEIKGLHQAGEPYGVDLGDL